LQIADRSNFDAIMNLRMTQFSVTPYVISVQPRRDTPFRHDLKRG
jgi:hypothetical protein